MTQLHSSMDKAHTLEEYKKQIKNEIPYVDIKPYSHNIIYLKLQLISDEYGDDVVKGLIVELGLNKIGW